MPKRVRAMAARSEDFGISPPAAALTELLEWLNDGDLAHKLRRHYARAAKGLAALAVVDDRQVRERLEQLWLDDVRNAVDARGYPHAVRHQFDACLRALVARRVGLASSPAARHVRERRLPSRLTEQRH